MSGFVLIRADAAATLVRDDPIVRAADVPALHEADRLLAAAAALYDEARHAHQAAADRARTEGFAAGQAEGHEAAVVELRTELLRLADADAARAEAQRADLARLALEVVRRIAADLGAPEMVAALADQAAAAVAPDARLTVRVPASALAATRERLGPDAVIEADPALGATDCILATPLGEIRAGLETQLAQIARQWGVA